MQNKPVETKIIGLRVTPEFERTLRVQAAQQGMGKSEYIRQALQEKLTRQMVPAAIGKQP